MNELTSLGEAYPTFGTRLSGALSFYGRHPFPLLLIAAANLPFAIGTAFGGALGLLLFIPSLIVQEIVGGAMAWAVYRGLSGSMPSPHEAFSTATDNLGALVEVSLRTVGAAFLLAITVVGIPWAIRLFMRWYFGTQAVMIQGYTAKEAISESCRLVTENWWRTFGNILAVSLPPGLIGIGVRLAVSGLAGAVIAGVWGIVFSPIILTFSTLLYLRYMHEKSMISATPAEPAP